MLRRRKKKINPVHPDRANKIVHVFIFPPLETPKSSINRSNETLIRSILSAYQWWTAMKSSVSAQAKEKQCPCLCPRSYLSPRPCLPFIRLPSSQNTAWLFSSLSLQCFFLIQPSQSKILTRPTAYEKEKLLSVAEHSKPILLFTVKNTFYCSSSTL